ncbi:hypothetical protein B0H11DRAFT_2309772 [Mycena galericulata]|nr:hypothetical protein B0H11DRAFT_2309772 [Mycena galericulata]
MRFNILKLTSLIPLAAMLTLANGSLLFDSADALSARQGCSITLCGESDPGVNCCSGLFCSSINTNFLCKALHVLWHLRRILRRRGGQRAVLRWVVLFRDGALQPLHRDGGPLPGGCAVLLGALSEWSDLRSLSEANAMAVDEYGARYGSLDMPPRSPYLRMQWLEMVKPVVRY